MADFKATPDQEAAMNRRDSALLVSAGAGSGKTKVLIERVVNRLKDERDPQNIDRFLIITFTRAAAAELRGRIMEKLSRETAKDPQNRHLQRQSALCANANIGTIHSFCTAILRENCQAVGLSPDFKILEEERAERMKSSVMERLLHDRYEEQSPEFIALVDAVSTGRDDSDLEALAFGLYEKMQSHARPVLWARARLNEMKQMEGDPTQSLWGRFLCQRAQQKAGELIKAMDPVLEEMEACPSAKNTSLGEYLDSMKVIRQELEAMRTCACTDWDAARGCLTEEVPNGRAITAKRLGGDEAAERAKRVHAAVKNGLPELKKIFYAPAEEIRANMVSAAPIMETLVDLVEEFTRRYSAEKRRAGVADYSDLEHYAMELLTKEDGSPTELGREVSARFCEVMVDEYQDVSDVQNALFYAVSNEGKNLFFVGDVKQSIYGFRLANPQNFLNTKKKYETGAGRVICLRENFRSRKEIIACANAIFENCMSSELGDVPYDAEHRMVFGAEYYEGEVPLPEVVLLRRGGAAEEGGEEEEDKVGAAEKDDPEAVYAARRILELTDPEKGGHFKYGDIAILMRSANARGPLFARVLERYGIPTCGGEGTDFFRCAEVSAMIAILTVVDNPHQDIALMAALSSPLFGFSPDELARVRAADKNNDLFTALLKFADAETEETAEVRAKAAYFLRKLESFRAAAPDTEPAGLLRRISTELDAPAVYSGLRDGLRRYENLLTLPRLADNFHAAGGCDLHRFVLWLERMAAREESVAARSAQTDAVQILTIHKSKGLEFPVVFVCGCGHVFNQADQGDRVLVDEELGLGPVTADPATRLKYQTLSRCAISEKMKEKLRSEEMRLLYVAVTRPKERLILTGSLKEKAAEKLLSDAENAAEQRVDGQQDRAYLNKCRNYLGWLVYACMADGEKHLELKVLEEAELTETETPQSESEGSAETEEPAKAPTDEAEPEETAAAWTAERLSYRYPYAEAEELPSKVTATELKGREAPDPEAASLLPPGSETISPPEKTFSAFRLPDFAAKDRPLAGAALGTAMHTVLQHIDPARTGSLREIRGELERMTEQGFLNRKAAEAISAQQLWELFASPLGERMRRADRVYREFKFSLLCRAGDLIRVGAAAAEEELLLQGVMDCVLIENGSVTVLDWKTDWAGTEERMTERTAFYTGQLQTYAMAAERIFRLPVKQCILYFLRHGAAVEIAPKKA